MTKLPEQDITVSYKGYVRKKIIFIIVLAAGTFAALVLSISSGSSGMNIIDIIRTIFGGGSVQETTIVWNMRMPRLLTALVGGTGLSIVGCVMQSVLRNPMASSSTLGVSQGAAFGAAFAIVVLGAGSQIGGNATFQLSNPYTISVCAFLSSMISTMVIVIMGRVKGLKAESMILTGVALGTLFAGLTAMMQYFADEVQMASIVYWTFGNLGNTTWREIIIMAVVTAFAFVFFMINRWNYNAFLGGENTAKGLGVNVNALRLASMIVGSLAASVITSYVGVLNFIGLIAPHMVRRVIGNDYRFLLPASAFAGAILLLVSDAATRLIIPPQVLPIGAITSFIGTPFFLWLIFRERKR